MHPILLHYRGAALGTYGVITLLSVVSGVVLTAILGRSRGVSLFRAWQIAATTVAVGVAGAKAAGMAVDLAHDIPLREVCDPLYLLRTAGTVHGAVFAGAACLAFQVRGAPGLGRGFLDIAAPSLALSMALGRLGCLSAGCCFGTPTGGAWGITFHDPMSLDVFGTPLEVPLHPVQLYSAALGFVVTGILLHLLRRRLFAGAVAGACLVLEGLSRVLVESWRGDPRGFWFGLQWLSTGRLTGALLVVIGCAMLACFRATAEPGRAAPPLAGSATATRRGRRLDDGLSPANAR